MTSYNPCPCCPDGNEWNANGPTGRVCKRCGGFAIMHLDGSRLTETEFNAATDGTSQPKQCKFPCPVAEVLLLGVIEVIPITDKARDSIAEVPVWTE